MKIQFYVKFYISLMGMFVSKLNTIHKYLYEESDVITCDNGEKNVFQEPYTIKDPFFVTGVIIH